jgi:hypothetical protein
MRNMCWGTVMLDSLYLFMLRAWCTMRFEMKYKYLHVGRKLRFYLYTLFLMHLLQTFY